MQQGDGRAFEDFLDLYGARVHRLVRRYVANPSDAEDVTQEIFVDLYRSIGFHTVRTMYRTAIFEERLA